MAGMHSISRYECLVAAFAASAFLLLGMLSSQLHRANMVTADVTRNATVMTNYRPASKCLIRRTSLQQRQATANYRFCRSK